MSTSYGLDVLPSMGSFMVTFNPSTDEWRLYGAIGNAFQDPTLVTTLLGSGVDAGYVNQALPYFGLGGGTTGLDIFDNVSVSVPEPSVISLIVSASVVTLSVLRGKVRRQKIA
jgi:hypothetical protein